MRAYLDKKNVNQSKNTSLVGHPWITFVRHQVPSIGLPAAQIISRNAFLKIGPYPIGRAACEKASATTEAHNFPFALTANPEHTNHKRTQLPHTTTTPIPHCAKRRIRDRSWRMKSPRSSSRNIVSFLFVVKLLPSSYY